MAARELPMFPLGSVLFPFAILPLHVFEPRYRVMVRQCLAGDQEFGVVLIERGSEVGGGDTRFDVGTLARIAHAEELPDGRFALTAVGLRRIRVARWLDDDPFPRAQVEVLVDETLPESAAARRDSVVRDLHDVLRLWRRLDPRVPEELPRFDDDPARAVYQVASVTPIGPLDAQRVLEADSFERRCASLSELLADEAALLRARLALEDGDTGP